jgi:RND superfamily putative drug exporter
VSQPNRRAQHSRSDHHTQTDAHVNGLYRFGLAYGRFISKKAVHWTIIALWLVALAAGGFGATKVGSVLSSGGYSASGSESAHVTDIVNAKFHPAADTLILVFQSSSTKVTDPAYQDELNRVIQTVKGTYASSNVRIKVTPEQITPSAPLPSANTGDDQKTAYVTIALGGKIPGAQDVTDSFQQKINDALNSGNNNPAKVYLTGGDPLDAAFSDVTTQDVEQAERYGLPVALVALIIIFGSLLAALLPLLLAGFAVPITLGVIYLIGLHYGANVFVLNIASIVGLGVSIDYSLFMVRRFREELARGRTVADAVGWTVATSGEAILFSGLTVMIGFSGLLLLGMSFMSSFGIGGMVTVGIAMLAALTLLPSLLAIIGPRINAVRVPYLWKMVGVGSARAAAVEVAEEQTNTTHGIWARLAEGVMRRPFLTILGVVALLLAMAWPLFSINIGTMSTSSLPASLAARQGMDIFNDQYPGLAGDPITVVAQTADGSSILTRDNVANVNQLTQWIDSQANIAGVTSVTQFATDNHCPYPTLAEMQQLYSTGAYTKNPCIAPVVGATTSGDTTIISVKASAKTESPAAKNLVNLLRDHAKAHAGDLKVYVGGAQATSLDFNDSLYGAFPRAALFIILATFILLLIMFRSALIPLKAVVMNVLSISAAFGFLVLVFQWGYGSTLLHFTPDGYIDSLIPIIMFCLLFGLSMDYEVFLLSRIREEWERTKNNRLAVARGLERTGGVITNAALLFIIVTAAFAFTRTVMTQEIGLGMSVSVLVDATIIRSLLVPATMRLLGRWNWWLPGRPVPQEREVNV